MFIINSVGSLVAAIQGGDNYTGSQYEVCAYLQDIEKYFILQSERAADHPASHKHTDIEFLSGKQCRTV